MTLSLRRAVAVAVLSGILPRFACAASGQEAESAFENPLRAIQHAIGHQILKQRLMSMVDKMLNDPPPSRLVTHQGVRGTLDGGRVEVLYLSGSPYEMGVEQGRLLSAELRSAFSRLAWSNSISLSLDKAWRKEANLLSTDQTEELAGLGEGVFPGPIGDKTVAQALRRLQMFRRLYGATRPVVVVRRPLRGHASSLVTWPGLLGGLAGVNAAGVAISTLQGNPLWVEKALRFAEKPGDVQPILFAAVRAEPADYVSGSSDGVVQGPDGNDWGPILRAALAATAPTR